MKTNNTITYIKQFYTGNLISDQRTEKPNAVVFNNKLYFETVNRKMYESDGTLARTKSCPLVATGEVMKRIKVEGTELCLLGSSTVNNTVRTFLRKYNGTSTTVDTLRLGSYGKPLADLVNGAGDFVRTYNKTYAWIVEKDSVLVFGINPRAHKITSIYNANAYTYFDNADLMLKMAANAEAVFMNSFSDNNQSYAISIAHQTQQAQAFLKQSTLLDIFSVGNAILLSTEWQNLGYEPCVLRSCTNPVIPITNIQADTVNNRVRLQWDAPANSDISKFFVYSDIYPIDSFAYSPSQTHYDKILSDLNPGNYVFRIKSVGSNPFEVCGENLSEVSDTVIIQNCVYAPLTATLQVIPQQPFYKIKWVVDNPTNAPIESFLLTRNSSSYNKSDIIPYIMGQNTYEYIDTLIPQDYNIGLNIRFHASCANSITTLPYTTTFAAIAPQAVYISADSMATTSLFGKNVRIKVKVANQYKIKPYTLKIWRERPNNCGEEVLYYSFQNYSDSIQIDTVQYKGEFKYFASILEPTYTVEANADSLDIKNANNYYVAKDFTASIVDFAKIAVDYRLADYLGLPAALPGTYCYLFYRKQGAIMWDSTYAQISIDSIVHFVIAPTQVGVYELRAGMYYSNPCLSNFASPIYTINKDCAQNIKFDKRPYPQSRNSANLYIPYCNRTQAQALRDRQNGMYYYCPADPSFIYLEFSLLQYVDTSNHAARFTIERKRTSVGAYQQIYEGAQKGFTSVTGPLIYHDYTPYNDDSLDYRIIIRQPDICGGNDTLNLALRLNNFPYTNYAKNILRIFPTMVLSGYTHILMPNPNATARAEFFNTIGQSVAVFQNLTQLQPMDISTLNEGMYIVYLTDSDGNKTTLKIQKRE